ncbi:alanyl-tRNA editing protein [Salipiger sp. IMCC34102]|uniref:alanyl-tRNA editing protein n=1 Tax=Salipiger sp. IMCC34102 TaxID=2510647 RepID=UPI00101B60E7|nr:alanyl-tRNA editing protein [Salipiger sp. IMCC34102]RYH03285.1 alanyl-tRNA editing protein [Salipiger sp. IMCC34102]
MSVPLYLEDAYRVEAGGVVTALTEEGGIVLDRTLFYPRAGGQPGDSGRLDWAGGSLAIGTTVKGQGDDIVLVPAEPSRLPAPGTPVTQRIDRARRRAHMRMHTALHLLSVVIPRPVTGGQIGADKSRLDFDMDAPPKDREAVQAALDDLVARDLPVTAEWITETALAAAPQLVKTLRVKPPRGAGRIRLVRIGEGEAMVDLQPCGGTHVARTGEIGALRLGKIEKKGRENRRVYLHLGNG